MTSRAMVIVGGGSSSRFGADKLTIEVAGRPLIAHTIAAVREHVDDCVLVCHPDRVEAIASLGLDVAITPGGATRTLSELAGLAVIDAATQLIGIHDAARPLVDGEMIESLFVTAAEYGGAVPIVGADELMVHRRTMRPVAGLGRAQTPQVFNGPVLLSAYARAAESGFEARDTAEVVERFSDLVIAAVPGDHANVKVTYREDIAAVATRLRDTSRT